MKLLLINYCRSHWPRGLTPWLHWSQNGHNTSLDRLQTRK